MPRKNTDKQKQTKGGMNNEQHRTLTKKERDAIRPYYELLPGQTPGQQQGQPSIDELASLFGTTSLVAFVPPPLPPRPPKLDKYMIDKTTQKEMQAFLNTHIVNPIDEILRKEPVILALAGGTDSRGNVIAGVLHTMRDVYDRTPGGEDVKGEAVVKALRTSINVSDKLKKTSIEELNSLVQEIHNTFNTPNHYFITINNAINAAGNDITRIYDELIANINATRTEITMARLQTGTILQEASFGLTPQSPVERKKYIYELHNIVEAYTKEEEKRVTSVENLQKEKQTLIDSLRIYYEQMNKAIDLYNNAEKALNVLSVYLTQAFVPRPRTTKRGDTDTDDMMAEGGSKKKRNASRKKTTHK